MSGAGEAVAGAGAARAWGWLGHLRAGGVTPWADWRGEATPGHLLPGAQHLELLRRVNAVRRPPEALVERILGANAVGRGEPDLPLTGVDGSRFGPAPVDPAALPAEELLRVAVGLVAEDLAAGGLPEPSAAATTTTRVLTRLRRRRYRLLGDPLVSGLLRDELIAAGRPPSARPDVLVLIAGPLDRLLAGAWIDSCFSTPAISWDGWLGKWQRLDRLPPRVDVGARAAELARGGRGRRVHVVLDTDAARRLVGAPAAPAPLVPPAPAGEVARRLHGPLGLLVPAHDRDLMIRHRLRPLLASAPDATVAVPERHRAWVDRQAARLAERLARAGYAVPGAAADVRRVPEGVATGPEPALDLAIACLLDGRLRKGVR